MEKITYLVANYNNGKYIEHCIDSLHTQTNPNWMCIIVDDKSTDESIKRIRPCLNNQIELFENDKNIGKSGSLKRIIEFVQTDIVAILDPDDVLVPKTTECLLNVYCRSKAIGLVHSRYDRYNEGFTEYVDSQGGKLHPGKTSLQCGFIGHILSFRVSCYRLTPGFDENLSIGVDRDIAYKLEEITFPIFVDKVLYKQRIVPTSLSNDKRSKEIGFTNHFKAKKNALDRRQIKGLERFFYLLIFWSDYLHDSSRLPHLLNFFILPIIKFLNLTDEIFCIRTEGILKRNEQTT